jgi:hypothetical protein
MRMCVLAVVVVVCACFAEPPPTETPIACTSDDQCPAGRSCLESVGLCATALNGAEDFDPIVITAVTNGVELVIDASEPLASASDLKLERSFAGDIEAPVITVSDNTVRALILLPVTANGPLQAVSIDLEDERGNVVDDAQLRVSVVIDRQAPRISSIEAFDDFGDDDITLFAPQGDACSGGVRFAVDEPASASAQLRGQAVTCVAESLRVLCTWGCVPLGRADEERALVLTVNDGDGNSTTTTVLLPVDAAAPALVPGSDVLSRTNVNVGSTLQVSLFADEPPTDVRIGFVGLRPCAVNGDGARATPVINFADAVGVATLLGKRGIVAAADFVGERGGLSEVLAMSTSIRVPLYGGYEGVCDPDSALRRGDRQTRLDVGASGTSNFRFSEATVVGVDFGIRQQELQRVTAVDVTGSVLRVTNESTLIGVRATQIDPIGSMALLQSSVGLITQRTATSLIDRSSVERITDVQDGGLVSVTNSDVGRVDVGVGTSILMVHSRLGSATASEFNASRIIVVLSDLNWASLNEPFSFHGGGEVRISESTMTGPIGTLLHQAIPMSSNAAFSAPSNRAGGPTTNVELRGITFVDAVVGGALGTGSISDVPANMTTAYADRDFRCRAATGNTHGPGT